MAHAILVTTTQRQPERIKAPVWKFYGTFFCWIEGTKDAVRPGLSLALCIRESEPNSVASFPLVDRRKPGTHREDPNPSEKNPKCNSLCDM